MRSLTHTLLGLALSLFCYAVPAHAACPNLTEAPTSRWSVAREGGARWLITPCGERFFSLGVNVVDGGITYTSGGRHYDWQRTDATLELWAKRAADRLDDWGFNTVGSWSLEPNTLKLPFVVNLELGRSA